MVEVRVVRVGQTGTNRDMSHCPKTGTRQGMAGTDRDTPLIGCPMSHPLSCACLSDFLESSKYLQENIGVFGEW